MIAVVIILGLMVAAYFSGYFFGYLYVKHKIEQDERRTTEASHGKRN